MKTLSIDIETFSSVNLAKSGVYRYSESEDFEILLFGYSVDGGPVEVVDFTAGEKLPASIKKALTDDSVMKWAFNAQFERVCISRFLGYPTGKYLDPISWHCTMVWAATLGLPLSLEGVGTVLGLEKQKLKEGKDLIRYFCTPSTAKNGSAVRHYPKDAPEKWERFKAYNLRDVETEMGIKDKLSKFPVPESEWMYYFWSKCEWEVLLTSWVHGGRDDAPELKIDVYYQLKMNWDHFVDYVWQFAPKKRPRTKEGVVDEL